MTEDPRFGGGLSVCPEYADIGGLGVLTDPDACSNLHTYGETPRRGATKMTTATATKVTVDQRFEHYARFMSLPYGPRRTAAHLAWSIESFAHSYVPEAVTLAVSVVSADADNWDAALDAFMDATGEYGDNYWNTPARFKAMKIA